MALFNATIRWDFSVDRIYEFQQIRPPRLWETATREGWIEKNSGIAPEQNQWGKYKKCYYILIIFTLYSVVLPLDSGVVLLLDDLTLVCLLRFVPCNLFGGISVCLIILSKSDNNSSHWSLRWDNKRFKV